VHVII